jgi:hypothetical protein
MRKMYRKPDREFPIMSGQRRPVLSMKRTHDSWDRMPSTPERDPRSRVVSVE